MQPFWRREIYFMGAARTLFLMPASQRLRAYEIEFKRQDDGSPTTMTFYAHDAEGALRLARAWGRKHGLSVIAAEEAEAS